MKDRLRLAVSAGLSGGVYSEKVIIGKPEDRGHYNISAKAQSSAFRNTTYHADHPAVEGAVVFRPCPRPLVSSEMLSHYLSRPPIVCL